MTTPLRAAALFLLGSLLLQAAWIIALPPLRGSDEFDHAYRAAAVAEGQWKPDYAAATNGRGWYLVVPRSLVETATPVCESYAYTGPDNCKAVDAIDRTHVRVASAAAKYSPVYYWIVGKPSLLFDDGTEKVLAMRATAAILSSLLLAAAAWAAALWAKTRWPLSALAVAVTPIVIYSGSLGAPNGAEMLAGLVAWAALLGLDRVPDGRRRRQLVVITIPAAVALVGLRAIGPLWLLLIVLSVCLIFGLRRTVEIVASARRHLLIAATIVSLSVVGAGWWIVATGMNSEPEGPGNQGHGTVGEHLRGTLLWVLQSIAAFPVRKDRAPTIVYACALLAIVTVLVIGVLRSERRVSRAIVAGSLFAVAISSFFNLITYDAWGQIWQGRYALPYMIGMPLLAAYGLEKRHVALPRESQSLAVGAALICIAQGVSVLNVLREERVSSPLAGTSAWSTPPDWIIGMLAVCGVLYWALACRDRRRRPASARATISERPTVAA